MSDENKTLAFLNVLENIFLFVEDWRIFVSMFFCSKSVNEFILANPGICRNILFRIEKATKVLKGDNKKFIFRIFLKNKQIERIQFLSSTTSTNFFKKLPNIREIVVMNSKKMNSSVLTLMRATKASKLVLRNCRNMENDDLEKLPAFLTDISIMSCTFFAAAGVNRLPRNLVSLDLTNCWSLDDEAIRNLFSIQKLKKLSLARCCRITNKGIVYVPKSVVDLDISWCTNVTNEGLKYLSKKMLRLDLSGCYEISDLGIDLLPKKFMKFLSLRKCYDISDKGLKYLPPKLTELNISDCKKVTDEGMKLLPATLRILSIEYCDRVSDEGIKFLPKRLTHLRCWKRNRISKRGIQNLVERGLSVK